MATQSQNQTQLLEKFRKLRQWQQQQQESMFRQQQQAMETLKMEQSKLQSILAAQKKLQESSLTVQSPHLGILSSQDDARRMMTQNHPQQIVRIPSSINSMARSEVGNDGEEFVGQKSSDFLRTIPTSSDVSISDSGLGAVSQGELPSRMSEMQIGVVGLTRQSEAPRPQLAVNDEERLEGSLAAFNATVYPMMWNSSNYRLPLGAIPMTAGTQGQSGLGSTSPISPLSHLVLNNKDVTDIVQGYQSPTSTPELDRLRQYNPGTENLSHIEMSIRGNNEAPQRNNVPPMTHEQQLERLWVRNHGAQMFASVESQVDEQSEADAMSGVYPLYDSESEVGVNETNDEENEEGEVDAESDAEEVCEDRTVIDLGTSPVETKGMVSFLYDCTS